MRPENEARLKKIQAISGLLRAVCTAFLVLPVFMELVMLSALVFGRGSFIPGQDTIRSRFVFDTYFTLQWVGMFFCVYFLHRLLGNYSRGEIFSRDSAKQIQRWGLACVLWGAMQFVWVFVPGAVSPHPANGQIQNYVPGVKAQIVDWQAHGGGLMVNGLIIVAISWFMEMAVEMREENELTV
ncbi:MAG: DUF2975 domain-containing protein [Acidobacteriaceae bacterium]